MLARYGTSASKRVIIALMLAALGAALIVTLLPRVWAQVADEPIEFPEIPEGMEKGANLVVANFTAVDPEGSSANWQTLGGDDAGDFSFKNGVLSFAVAPNFEAPADADTDNEYEITLMATDGTQDVDEEVTIKVTNVDEDATVGIALSVVQPREKVVVTVDYMDNVGNPFVDSAGADHTGIVDPDGDKATTGPAVTDTERAIPAGDVTWQWSRGSSRTGTFTDIAESENPTRNDIRYDPIDTDRGNYLRVTATYEDNEGEGKTLVATALYPTLPSRADVKSPNFPTDFDSSDQDAETPPKADVADGATENTRVGSPVRATGEGGERLTYSLTSAATGTAADADLFQVDRATGQVSVGIGKTINPFSDSNDAVSGKPSAADTPFRVTITAIDGVPADTVSTPNVPHSDTVVMEITVKPEVDEPPVFTAGKESYSYDENQVVDDTADPLVPSPVDTFTAYDPETATALTAAAYKLTGTDASKFELDTTTTAGSAILNFKAIPNFESPTDANKDNTYEITVTATATTDGESPKSTAMNVTVEVKNVNEDGTLSMSARQPRIGVPITARVVSDPDGAVRDLTWQWERSQGGTAGAPLADTACADASTAWEAAKGDGVTSATYTPNSDDDGKCLRATASYTDGQGATNGNVPSDEVVERARNLAPKFTDEDTDASGIQINPREVPENAGATVDNTPVPLTVGARVAATDTVDAEGGDNANIDYSLSGPDASLFEVNDDGGTEDTGGQISVKASTKLDYETKRTYMVTVTATDLEGLSSSVNVTIKITGVNEGPAIKRSDLEVSGAPLIAYTSMSTDDVATYTAVGVDSSGATWSLSGDDVGDFSISTTGVLTFSTPPDSANPADANMDNVYMVTVEATSGDSSASKDVTVTVGMAAAETPRTSLDQYTNHERFDLNGDGTVDDSEVRQVLSIWAQDNPGN